MPNELKPCPFCGNMPYQHPETKRIWCDTYGCVGTDILATNTDKWNSRPTEDALQARIAELEKEVEMLKRAKCQPYTYRNT